MGYPMHEDPETATFWANVARVDGVRFNRQTNSKSAPSTPAEKGSGPGADLYEITTDAAANTINDMVAASDAFNWWGELITMLYNPAGAFRDVVFEIVGDAMKAGIAARKFWHDHKFAKGDRIYISTNVAYPSGEVTVYCGCSVLGSDYNRFIQKGSSFSREDMQRIDNYYGAIPDPLPPVVQLKLDSRNITVRRTSMTLDKGSWVPGKEPPETLDIHSVICEVSADGVTAPVGVSGQIVYEGGDLKWTIKFNLTCNPGVNTGLASAGCQSIAENEWHAEMESIDPSGVPDQSRAWYCYVWKTDWSHRG
ncbi:hypothetical protein [Polyangium jinanense]|uniref:Uncharacterized protein n=1 Tax=Polyangium jinanense TaxID=2829994 RepID=A0A9X3XG69_9BACT|nr:hypothetical protein [Polyangium jinanense]MDC3962079.1 hypothetical protein [Polyangium jinanense]MDC3988795.1 hypothetical protein [Polyangium jinanense]